MNIKLENRKRWLLKDLVFDKDLKNLKKPDQKHLYKIQDNLFLQLKCLLEEINAFEKINNLLPFLHSIILQEKDDQLRMYADFWIENQEGELVEKKISIGTVGLRLEKKEREKMRRKFFEIKSVFSALNHISKAILALKHD
jgi:hypothetical protein